VLAEALLHDRRAPEGDRRMSDLSAESVRLRRRRLAELGFCPVAVDRDGNPGVAWRPEAPVDPNAPYTGLLLGADGAVEALIAVGLDLDPEKGESSQQLADNGLEDRVSIFATVIDAIGVRIGRTPLCRRRAGQPVFLYRSRRSPAWGWADIQASGVFVLDAEGDDWPDQRPEDVPFASLPFLDNKTWIEALAAGVGAVGENDDEDVLDQLRMERVEPAADGCGFGPGDPTPGPPPLPGAPDRQAGDRPPHPPPPEPPDGPPPPMPKIIVKAGKRHIAADRGLAALYGARVPLYNRGGELVRIERAPAKDAAGQTLWTPGIRALPIAGLARLLAQSAMWFRLTPDKMAFRVDPPWPVVNEIFAMGDRWRFPPLAGVIRTPTLRANLSLLSEPGYDQASGLFAAFDRDLKMPRIAAKPTRRQAEDALKLLLGIFSSFPFVGPRDCATAIAALLTVMCRTAIEVSPLFVITSPLPGTGKSYIVDCISAVATGDRAAVIAIAPKEEETEKRLVGAALLGNPIIVLDNCRRLLEGDFLCQVTERPLLQLRPLGTSDVRQIRNIYTTFATGNNVVTAADMTRRSTQIAMDANCERPELREFDGDPRREILALRGDYIAACLTIPRYYIGAGRPNLRRRLASYEQWSDLIRSPLVHLGMADAAESQTALLAEDPVAQHRRTIFAAWDEALKRLLAPLNERGLRVRELVEFAKGDSNRELFEALMEVAEGQHAKGELDHGRLGRWLLSMEDAVADGTKLICDRSDPSRPRWRLDPAIPGVEG
jgi:putative DNA primase/helicase